jgi:hypothetical protein
MRTIVLFLSLLLNAGVLLAQQTPEEYIKTFFGLVGEKKYTEAIEKMPVNKRLENDTSYLSKVEIKLATAGNRAGEYCGYELIEKEELTPSYITYNYFIKYYNAPQKVQFVFYKPKNEWMLIQINLNVQGVQGMGMGPGMGPGKRQPTRKR